MALKCTPSRDVTFISLLMNSFVLYVQRSSSLLEERLALGRKVGPFFAIKARRKVLVGPKNS